MDDAIRYLRLLQEIQPVMQEVQVTLNRIEDKDEEILNLFANYRRECLAYEACREGGIPPTATSGRRRSRPRRIRRGGPPWPPRPDVTRQRCSASSAGQL